ncbi:hypothetical protein [Oceanospirillum beijerinckii]|uniref:hypothetical protein n=1 Tax=Oceanospirillum beijerinckii TaxID=64976 RepID=UPI000480ACA1|nr:hypothetical protein [Oceanospirillum beijerinckii]MAC48031.1 hypothetical protein [Oceanospirillum sp.]
MRYILFSILILTNSPALAENANQWGSWGQSPDRFRQEMESDTPLLDSEGHHYGSGIAGTDEKLLHELDQSSLLDYQQSDTRYNVSFSVSPAESADSDFEVTDIITLTGVDATGLSEGTLDLSKVSELPNELVDLLQAEGIALENVDSITIETMPDSLLETMPEPEIEHNIADDLSIKPVD